MTRLLKSTTPRSNPLFSVTTSSPPIPKVSTRSFLEESNQLICTKNSQSNSTMILVPFPPKSTGSQRVKLTQSRTRDTVAHAGLSLLPVLLKVLMPSRLESSFLFLSNNLWTATLSLKDVRVDGNTPPSSTCRRPHR